MLDLSQNWPRVPDWENDIHATGDIEVRTVTPASQHLVSGNLEAFDASSGLSGTGVGAFAVVDGSRATLRLARDRVLVIDGEPSLMVSGWHEEGFAVTDVSATFHVFEITGPGLRRLLEEATALDLDNPGPSASIVFAGLHAVAYHVGDRNRLRVHVERGFATHVWSWLKARD